MEGKCVFLTALYFLSAVCAIINLILILSHDERRHVMEIIKIGETPACSPCKHHNYDHNDKPCIAPSTCAVDVRGYFFHNVRYSLGNPCHSVENGVNYHRDKSPVLIDEKYRNVVIKLEIIYISIAIAVYAINY